MSLKIGNLIYPTVYRGGVFVHMSIHDDLRDLLERIDRREQAKVKALLLRQLEFLDEHGASAVAHGAWFERLKHQKEAYYAMRIICLANIRIIYIFIDRKPFLLCAFGEKAKGSANTKSYSAACSKAEGRLTEIREELGHDKNN